MSRITKQRKVVLEVLSTFDSHPTADMVYEKVRERLPRISLGTVYRNLEVLAEEGIIRKLTVGNDRKRFDHDVSDHNHIRCVVCRRIDDVEYSLTALEDSTIDKKGYELIGQTIIFWGKCPDCLISESLEKNVPV